jgi:hypothetical protein
MTHGLIDDHGDHDVFGLQKRRVTKPTEMMKTRIQPARTPGMLRAEDLQKALRRAPGFVPPQKISVNAT